MPRRKARIDNGRKSRHSSAMSKPVVTTARKAIELLGGKTTVGAWWGIGDSGMRDMLSRNRISAHFCMHTIVGLRVLGHEMSPRVVGLKSWSALLPPDVRGKGARIDLSIR